MTKHGSEIEHRSDRPLEQMLGERWQDGLEAVVTAQLEQYGSLDAISMLQRECIEANDTDRLMGLLGERAGLIEAIAESAQRFAPYVEAWSEVEAELSEDVWNDLARRLEAIASIGDSISARDVEDTLLIQQNRDLIAGKLSGVTKSASAAKAYAGPRPSGARYQDREA